MHSHSAYTKIRSVLVSQFRSIQVVNGYCSFNIERFSQYVQTGILNSKQIQRVVDSFNNRLLGVVDSVIRSICFSLSGAIHYRFIQKEHSTHIQLATIHSWNSISQMFAIRQESIDAAIPLNQRLSFVPTMGGHLTIVKTR